MNPTTAAQKFVTDRLINRQSGGVGAAIPPAIAAGIQVSDVSNLRITSTTANLDGSNTFVLAFDEPVNITWKIDHYNIYAIAPQETKMIPVQHSPVSIKITTAGAQIVVFKVQVVLAGGLGSSLT